MINAPDFNEYFESQGFDEQHRAMFLQVWNAAIESAVNLITGYEGYDFEIKADLQG